MKLRLKTASLAVLLTGASWCTFAQVVAPSGPVGMHPPMIRMDPAKRQAAMQKRAEELKAQLKLEPAQDGAWTTLLRRSRRPMTGSLPARTAKNLPGLPRPKGLSA